MKHLLMASAIALALAGCTKEGADNGTALSENSAEAKRPSGTLAEALGNGRFAQAAKSAGLEQTLKGAGPYTVLAPSDDAFGKLPAERAQALQGPGGKEELTRVLTHHILPGTMLSDDIGKAIDAGGGKTLLASLGGGTLTATRQGNAIVITDAAGGKATLTGSEQVVENGVIHPIDAVLSPASR